MKFRFSKCDLLLSSPSLASSLSSLAKCDSVTASLGLRIYRGTFHLLRSALGFVGHQGLGLNTVVIEKKLVRHIMILTTASGI